jgi:hypothetical protein
MEEALRTSSYRELVVATLEALPAVLANVCAVATARCDLARTDRVRHGRVARGGLRRDLQKL